MSKFSRSWTMQLKTDKQGFKDAFFKVVNSRDYNVPDNTNKVGEDCWGSVYSNSFSIHKRRGEDESLRLEGKIAEDNNGLLLELYLRTNHESTLLGVKAFAFSAILSYGIAYLPFIHPLIEDYFIVCVIFVVIGIFPLVFWVVWRGTMAAVNASQHDFIVVLNEIEKHIIPDKKYSTQ